MSSAAIPAHPIPGVSYRTEAEARAYYRSGAWLQLTIGDAARRAARLHPDRPFLVGERSTTTFGGFDAVTERLAAALLRAGLVPGDRALFQMGTTPDTAIALGGCFKAGIVPVCTLPQHRELEIGQIGGLAAPRAYFVQADFNPKFDLLGFARRMGESLPSRPMLIVADEGGAGGASLAELIAPGAGAARAASVPPNPADVAIFQLSGGSTGVPKIIPRMHGEYLAQARDWNERNHLRAADVSLWCLPLIHNAGIITALLPCLLAGRTLVLQPAFREESFLEAIARHRVTDTGSIGPIAGRLLESPLLACYDLGSLRHLWTFNRADDLEARLGATRAVHLRDHRGHPDVLFPERLSGAAPPNHREPGRALRRDPAARHRRHRTGARTASLASSASRARRCSPPTTAGTAGDPAQFTEDGFFRTGDVLRAAWVDGERCFAFEGRLKDNISRGGEKYGAEEVETLLVRHPAVLDARVVAMPDRIYGEKGCAFLILREGRAAPSLAELGEFLTGLGLAKYKLPERIELVGEFPLTRVGKVDKVELRARIAAMCEARTGDEGPDRRRWSRGPLPRLPPPTAAARRRGPHRRAEPARLDLRLRGRVLRARARVPAGGRRGDLRPHHPGHGEVDRPDRGPSRRAGPHRRHRLCRHRPPRPAAAAAAPDRERGRGARVRPGNLVPGRARRLRPGRGGRRRELVRSRLPCRPVRHDHRAVSATSSPGTARCRASTP